MTWLRLICAAVILWQVVTAWPVVPPPGPGPGPGPNPPPPDVVVEGRRNVVIIHESEDDSALFAQMMIGLRAGANASYLASKGHTLLILDDEAADQNGQPNETVAALLPLNSTLPALFILDAGDGRPLHNETLSASATAADVMGILREHGG